jgi:DNA-binding winged helix-turn-helix (wHTH) protein
MKRGRTVMFGGFRLDFANQQLWQGAQAVALRPKAFAVLVHLVEHAGELVTKNQLLEAVWPGTFVGDAVLKDSIRQVRARRRRRVAALHRDRASARLPVHWAVRAGRGNDW